MKKIIFVGMGLGIGGTEKTLVEAVNSVDYDRFIVDVYLRKDREDYVPMLDDRANILINRNMPLFENRPYARLCTLLSTLFTKLKMGGIADEFRRKWRSYVLKKRRNYEMHYFEGKMYDCAIAYDMALECVSFVKDCIPANKKVAFFHASRMNKAKKELYESFDRIITVNSEVAKSLVADYPDLQCRTDAIENYIEIEIPPTSMVDHKESELVLCSCGRFSEEKGFDLAIEAAKEIKQFGISFRWYFVGDGKLRDRIELLIHQYNLSEEIILTGFQKNPLIYMNNCDIYVQPSLEEAHATTMIEAMLLRKPIVSTDTCSGRYFKKEYGSCIISPIRSKELANTIIMLYRDKQLNEQIIDRITEISWEKRKYLYRSRINDMLDRVTK